jgi:hypothetical protein
MLANPFLDWTKKMGFFEKPKRVVRLLIDFKGIIDEENLFR